MTTTIAPSLGHAPLMTQLGTGTSPGYDAIDLRRLSVSGLQEGVMAAGSYEVTQRGAGANMSVDVAANVADALGTGVAAYVQGDAVTAQGLYPVPPHSAVINEAISAAHATLPRVDQIILEIQDHTHDASGQNRAQVRVVAGTATSGATLDNRTGAAALPSSALLLADVLVANGAATITNSVIRDRRKWARGAHCRIVRNANAGAADDYTTGSTTFALLDGTNLAPRIECSGVPVRVTVAGTWSHSAGSQGAYFSPQVDSAGVNGMPSVGGGLDGLLHWITHASRTGFAFTWEFTPSAGSHIIAPAFAVSGGTLTIAARAARPLIWTVEELVQQDTRNNATTSG